MGKFIRGEVEPKISIKRISADLKVILGASDEKIVIEQYQVLTQDSTDGKFYKYVSGDADKGVIAGLYMGEELTIEADGDDVKGTINSLIIIGESDVIGVDFVADFTALSELKRAGVFIVKKIEGTEEV